MKCWQQKTAYTGSRRQSILAGKNQRRVTLTLERMSWERKVDFPAVSFTEASFIVTYLLTS